MDFLTQNWCNLNWSPWYPFRYYPAFLRNIPPTQGVYRVMFASQDILAYVGQTINLKRRMRELVPNTLMNQMPFNDPHTAAQSLWAWHNAEGFEYEVSVATTQVSGEMLKALECYLLWQYRLEHGDSTLCNHGRFHANYSRSTNRKQGTLGGRLPDGQINPACGLSHPPLPNQGCWPEQDWMGLKWTSFQLLDSNILRGTPPVPGVYKIASSDIRKLNYIGETDNLRDRLFNHMRKIWDGQGASFAYHKCPSGILRHQLHEIENDLIGGYYTQANSYPKFQFQSAR